MNKNILLVGDDPAFAVSCGKSLEAFGYLVRIVRNGETAIDESRTPGGIDLILMDIDRCPGRLDGIETARAILKEREVPVIFLSSHVEPETARKTEKITFYGYVIKGTGGAALDASIKIALKLFSDASGKKAEEKKLELSERRYRRLVENSPDAVYTFSNRRGGIYYSPRAAEIFGYSLEYLYAHPYLWNESIHPDDRPAIAKAIREFQEGKPFEVEYRIRNASGEWRWLSDRSIGRRIENDEVFIEGMATDITERVETHNALENANKFLATVIEDNPHSTWISDEKGTLIKINRACRELLNITEENVVGKYNIFKDNIVDEQGYMPEVKRVFDQGGTARFEIFYDTAKLSGFSFAGSRQLILDVTIYPIKDTAGKITNAVIQHTDVTERRRAEEKVKVLLSEKELLLKEVHHRLKNNMNTVASLLTLQAEGLEDASAVAAVREAGGRVACMAGLYDRLYRSDDFRETSFKEFIDPMLETVVNNFPNGKNIRIEKNISDFMLDTRKLSSAAIIINELITNSMKYAFTDRENGLISISASEKEGRATIIVRDDGAGLPDTLDLDGTSTFGLQLVNMMTRQLRGNLSVERGSGAGFIIEFSLGG